MGKLYGIKNGSDLLLRNITTNEPVLFIDYCNSVGLSVESSTVYATAKSANRISWKGDTTATLTITTQIMDNSLLALMLGTSMATTSVDVSGKYLGTVTSGKITLPDTPVTGSIAVMAADGERGFLTVGGTASPTNVTVTGKDISFDSTLNSKQFYVFYLKSGVSNKSFTVNVNSTSSAYKATMYTQITLDADNSNKFVLIDFPKLKAKEGTSFTFDSANPSEFNVEFDVLQDSTGNLFTFTELA